MEDHVMYRSLFLPDVFTELNRLQREMQQAYDPRPGIRGLGRGGFPALNLGATPQTVEVYAFAPGLDPATVEVNLDQGVLSIAGERKAALPAAEERSAVHINERFAGRFRRTMVLPDDIDADSVSAGYRDGVLHISVKRRSAAQPRRITIQ
jgi:HSP20 family protein